MADVTRTIKRRFHCQNEDEDIRVVDVHPDRIRLLLFEDSVQGIMSLDQIHQPVLEYVGLMMAVLNNTLSDPQLLLNAGLGCCVSLHAARDRWPDCHIVNVEASATVVDVAKRFFHLPADADVVREDLRDFLGQGDTRFDGVLADCYGAHNMPPYLMTREFMILVKNRLKPGAPAVFNIWNESCNQLARHQLHTLLDVFGEMDVFTCCRDDNSIALVAGDGHIPLESDVYYQGSRYRPTRFHREKSDENRSKSDEAVVLTDDNLASFMCQIGVANSADDPVDMNALIRSI